MIRVQRKIMVVLVWRQETLTKQKVKGKSMGIDPGRSLPNIRWSFGIEFW